MTSVVASSPSETTPSDAKGTSAIDWGATIARLARDGFALDVGEAPERFAGGLANVNIRVTLDGRPAVFRCPPAGPLPRGAHDMAREHRVLSRLSTHWPLAPDSLYLCKDREIIGVPFQILEYRDGIVVRGDRCDPLVDSPETGRRLTTLMVDTLIGLHAIDPDKIGLGDLGRPDGHLTRTLEGWTRRAHDVLPARSSSADAVISWLRANLHDRDVTPTLLHSDFKLDNMILTPGGDAVVAVLDWDMATRGDPLMDLATLLSYWTEAGDPPCMHRLAQMPTARGGFGTRAEVAAAYAARSGRSLDGLLPIRVLAMLKLGVVFHQLYAQHGAKVQSYTGFATLADELLEFAADTTRASTI